MAISVNSKTHSIFGDKAAVVADLAFSGTYPYGGVSLDNDRLFGIHDVELALIESRGGYSFQHDRANKKIKIFGPAPPICYEEKQTPSSDIVTTKYPAAFIMNVARSGNNKKLRSTGIALADLSDDEVSLVSVMAAGVRTQIRVKDYDRLSGQGAFTSGVTTGWTFSDSLNDWTTGGDKLLKDANGVETITHAFAPVIGRRYRLSYVISSWTVGTVTPTCAGNTLTAAGANGTFTEEFTAVSAAALVFTPTDTSRFTIDTITLYDISEPVYITYVTQAWKDVWDNLVQDEAITLATGANTLGEIITVVNDRTFAGASNWANVDINAYDETTGGYMELVPSVIGQYCVLPVIFAPTVIGTAYRLTISSASLTDTFDIYDFSGQQKIGTISTGTTAQTFDFTAEHEGGLRIVAVTATASVRIDNVSLSPGNKILACMYVDQTAATAAALTMIDEDDTEATGEALIKFNASINQITVHSDQDAKTAKITYVKVPASGFLKDRLFTNETATKIGINPYVNVFDNPILLWGYSGQMPVNGGVTQRMIDYGSTPGAGEFKIDWGQKPRVYANPPPLVVEEVATCAANVGTLAYLPLYIVAVQVTATTTTGSYSVIPVGKTPATKQVAVDFTTGGLTFLSTDEVTSVKVTYIPKRESGYLSSVTVDESFATAAAGTPRQLGAVAGLIQYVWDSTDATLATLEQANVEPTATHRVQIEQTTVTKVDTHANDDGNTFLVTYVPLTQLPPGCSIGDADITLSAEIWNFTGDPTVLGYNHLVVPGYGVHFAGEEAGTTSHYGLWVGPTGTDGNGIALWNPAMNSITTDDTTAITILTMGWMILDPNQLTPYAVLSGQAIDVKSNVTGSGAGVGGAVSEIATVPLEINEISLSDLTSVKGIFLGH